MFDDCPDRALVRVFDLVLGLLGRCVDVDAADDCDLLASDFDLVARPLVRGAVATEQWFLDVIVWRFTFSALEGRVDVDAAGDCDIVSSISLISTGF